MKKKINTAIRSFANFIKIPPRISVSKKDVLSAEPPDSNTLSTSESLFFENSISLNDFDENYYLKRYPDVAAAGIDPYVHFVTHGKAEGRSGTPYNLYKEVTPCCGTKETILLVSHDASRTGAPILALNIAHEIKKQFNVVILLLNGGAITSFFEKSCNTIISIEHPRISYDGFIDNLVNDITQKYTIKLSIVNSVESVYVLKPLAKRFIPTLLLIHEFAAYTRPNYKFMESFLWAGTIVFSAKIVQENAISVYTRNAIHRTHILSQGKSNIPVESDEVNKSPEVDKINIQYNKHQSQSKPFIVLGAGFVHYRKGIDLFIATAAELERSYPECNIKMLWVGAGYEPEHDVSYSCYLAEQIKRSGLKYCFELIDELPNLAELYKKIDLFYLSSRLDPLPNVAIDVMMLGKPLICFDKGSGIAEILAKDINTAECIVPHLSVIESTKKIVQFYQSTEYYSLISLKIKKLAQNHFDMNNYVTRLIGLFESQIKLAKQEKLDCITLKDSADFKEEFFLKSDSDREDAIRRYVRSWHSKTNFLRKPAPGFNQIIYDFYNGCRDTHIEPFADYLRSGKPEGPWQESLLTPNALFAIDEKKLNCAIHIHAFYPDLLQDILERIPINESVFDIYVSTNASLFSQVFKILTDCKQTNFKLHEVPNKGRDLGPFLSEFALELQQYDVIGHFHTKKSMDIKNADFARDWFHFLIENLLGGQHRMADQIMNEFNKNPELGLVFADDPHLLDWGENRIFANELAEQLGLTHLPDCHFNFPVGTMFWARPNAIKPLFELEYSWDMYPEEPLLYDGSILHAIERLIPVIAANQGFTQAVTYIPGLTR